jgi:hypothetical protein
MIVINRLAPRRERGIRIAEIRQSGEIVLGKRTGWDLSSSSFSIAALDKR